MASDNFKETETTNFPRIFFLNKYMTNHAGFVAGGCFKNLLNGEFVKDVDVYFEEEEDFLDAVNYYKELVKENKGYKQGYKNKKVISFIDTERKVRVELIKSVFGTAEEIINQFDFTITKMAYFKEVFENEDGQLENRWKLMHHKDFFEHLHMKRLVIDKDLPFPLSTFERSYKYQNYGYGLCKESKVKLVNAIRDIPNMTDDMLSKSFYNGID